MAIRVKYRRLPKSPPFSPLSSKSVDYYLKLAKKTGKLNLTQKGLTEIPKEVIDFSNLHFDDEIRDEEPLKVVDLSNNLITTINELPESSFGSCTHLFLKQNKLTHLPEQVLPLFFLIHKTCFVSSFLSFFLSFLLH